MIQRRTLYRCHRRGGTLQCLLFPDDSLCGHASGEGSDPIRIVVPYPPGGPLDVSARTIAEAVVDTLGNVIVDNRPGAGGGVGMGYVKRRPGDGRTLVVGAVATHAINPHLYKRLPYDAKKDFKAVTLIAHVPNVPSITPEFSQKTGVKTVQNLVEYAKKNPRQAQLRLRRQRQRGPHGRRMAQADQGHRHGSRPVRGCRRRAALRARGSDRPDLRQPRERHRQHPRGQAPCRSPSRRMCAQRRCPTSRRCRRRASPTSTSPRGTASSCPPPRPTTWSRTSTRRSREPLRSAPVQERLEKLGGVASPTTPEEFQELVTSESEKYARLVKLSGARVD